MVAAASRTVESGSPTCLLLFGPGTPLKVFTFAWASGGISALGFLPAVVLNRVSRIAPLAFAEACLGLLAPGFLRRREPILLGLYAVVYIATYVVYLA
jgi:hypothetical protein